jgi:hypothetical protein
MNLFRNSKARQGATEQDHHTGKRRSHRKGDRIYCWKFNHPKFGWCGGHADDQWSTDRKVIETRMSYCEWPTELIEAVA